MPTTEGLPALARPAARHLVCGALTLPPHSRRVAPVRSEVPGAVSLEDFRSLKDRLQPMPRTTPLDGEWQRMLDKETSVMTYKAWRHNLPVRGTPCPLRRPGGTQTGVARFGQLRPRAVRRGKRVHAMPPGLQVLPAPRRRWASRGSGAGAATG